MMKPRVARIWRHSITKTKPTRANSESELVNRCDVTKTMKTVELFCDSTGLSDMRQTALLEKNRTLTDTCVPVGVTAHDSAPDWMDSGLPFMSAEW